MLFAICFQLFETACNNYYIIKTRYVHPSSFRSEGALLNHYEDVMRSMRYYMVDTFGDLLSQPTASPSVGSSGKSRLSLCCCLSIVLIYWLVYWMIVWSIGALIDWCIDWLVHQLVYWLIDILINWCIDWSIDKYIDLLTVYNIQVPLWRIQTL